MTFSINNHFKEQASFTQRIDDYLAELGFTRNLRMYKEAQLDAAEEFRKQGRIVDDVNGIIMPKVVYTKVGEETQVIVARTRYSFDEGFVPNDKITFVTKIYQDELSAKLVDVKEVTLSLGEFLAQKPQPPEPTPAEKAKAAFVMFLHNLQQLNRVF